MKAKFFSIICLTILLAGCTKNVNESVPHNESTDTRQTSDIKDDNTVEESAETSSNGIFPPEGITAPLITTPHSEKEYEPGESIPAGRKVLRFYLEDAEYIESMWGVWAFVIEDDGNIVVEGEYEYEDNEVVKALRGLYSLEYVGLSYLNEHLFRYGDDLLAIAQSHAEKRQSVYFKDSDYDESQFYYAYMFNAYKPHGVFPPEGITAPTTPIQLSTHEYETGEEVPAGNHAECFELDGIRYVDSAECGSFDFVIEDNWKIVVEGEFEHEDNKVVIALRNLYSLEYMGLSHIDEHLFCFGNDILAIAKSPAAKIQSVYFKDYDYDESQFYYARIYEPYDFN